MADLGTNSTRLLVADVGPDGSLEQLFRRSQVTRLGDGVDASGRLADDAMERVFTTLASYREIAEEHKADRQVAVATSAVRDAENGEEFEEGVRERSGFDIRTISGDEEAHLTFSGATARRHRGQPTLVVDIGGGSTEYVVGRPGEEPSFHVSTRLGSVRQTERHLPSDPPPPEELEALAAAAREIVTGDVPSEVRAGVREGIAVAGTATTLAAIDKALDPHEPGQTHGFELGLPNCELILERLARISLEERRRVVGLHPDRAPTIVAGAAILVESMRAFGLNSMEASEADILHGVALEAGGEGGGRWGETG